MTSQLEVYNLCLGHLGMRALNSLSEQNDVRRALDQFWNHCIAYCQDQGLWAFMVRVVQQDASVDVVPAFGWEFAFDVPADYVRMVLVSTNETLIPPLLQYSVEQQWIYANFTPLYYSYVSNSTQYGMNLGKWPEVFTEYVSIALARMACRRVTGDGKLLLGSDGLINREKKARQDARSKDAMNLPPGFMPMSTWVKARRGFMSGNWDSGALPTGGF